MLVSLFSAERCVNRSNSLWQTLHDFVNQNEQKTFENLNRQYFLFTVVVAKFIKQKQSKNTGRIFNDSYTIAHLYKISTRVVQLQIYYSVVDETFEHGSTVTPEHWLGPLEAMIF